MDRLEKYDRRRRRRGEPMQLTEIRAYLWLRDEPRRDKERAARIQQKSDEVAGRTS